MPLLPPIRDVIPLLCYVTDRRRLSASPNEQTALLIGKIIEAARAGVNWIQIREKDLSAKELSELSRQIIRAVPGSCRVLINDRLDVACAVGAAGVHLGEKSIPVREAKRFASDRGSAKDFLIGASVHTLDAARAAETDGVDYVIYGPVFATPSKATYGAPQGLVRLADICSQISIPVLAIGGITPENARDCRARGARGIAAIRIFQEADNLNEMVQYFRA